MSQNWRVYFLNYTYRSQTAVGSLGEPRLENGKFA